MENQPRFLLTVICLTAMLIAPVCRAIDGSSAATPKEFGGVTPLEWSVRMADSETARRGDSLAWRPGRTVKWDYAAGLFTLSLLKLNEAVPTAAYIEFSKDAIGSFIADDGKIHCYRPEEYSIDNVAPGTD
jgi:unsaturated rhamnogalacturonyl hydrolase